MCKKSGTKHVLLLMVTLVTVLSAAICLSDISGLITRADSTVVVSLETPEPDANSGDIVTVNIVADNFPHITRFNNIVLEYEAGKAEFISYGQPQELGGFLYSCDSSDEGFVIISAADEQTEEDLEQFRNSGDESYDISYSSEEKTVLVSLSFRVSGTVAGDIMFRLSDVSGFIDSSGEEASILVNEELTLSITPSVSGDSKLAFLSVGGTAITPEFDQNVYEYTCSINRQTTEIVVTATPSNLSATVEVFGANDLELGENLVTVNVTSEDGTSVSEYKIHVTRQESYVPEGSGLVDNQGKIYTFLNFPQDVTIPEGFSQATRIINGYSVPVYVIDGIPNILVYLYDGENEPALYFYNPLTHNITLYDFYNTVIKPGKVLTVSPFPEDMKLPDGLYPEIRQIGGRDVEGFTNSYDDFICYMVDEDMVGGFYLYDYEEGEFHEYRPYSDMGSQVYRSLFYMFLIVTIAESIIIIVVIFVVRKVVLDRTNPRPKRV